LILLARSGKKVIRFYNQNGSLDNVVKFLEEVQKKINYLNLNVSVDGTKTIKITLVGPRDLQYLASDRIRDLAQKYFQP
jgi:hypothetical protein